MIKDILNTIASLIEENIEVFASEREKKLLQKVKVDLASFNPINFYALDAEKQITNALELIESYCIEMSRILDELNHQSSSVLANENLISKIKNILTDLKNKQNKIHQLRDKIPEGMLDIKRALYIAESSFLSKSQPEEKELKSKFKLIKQFMSDLDKEYLDLMKKGGLLSSILLATTTLYWTKLRVYSVLVNQCHISLQKSHQLTEEGQLALRCFNSAVQKMPSKKSILNALKILSKLNNKAESIEKIGFFSPNGREACIQLARWGKPFFYIPRSEEMYHFDYDPKEDLNDTGGNCFGESMMFIHFLSKGAIRWLCPEAGLINFQLDQTRNLKFKKATLGEGETVVSDNSPHDSIQWEDMKPVLLDNPYFKPGSLCGVIFSMNDYTKAKREFTAGHIIVVAKLDIKLNPYKYIVYERDFGAFGLTDDESLEYLISEQILPLYRGMNYSKIKLVKYGEASTETYDLLNEIKPQTGTPKKESIVSHSTNTYFDNLFFKLSKVINKENEMNQSNESNSFSSRCN
ncbi:TPA: type IV secretion protein Dot [Legionella pneumophila]|nr:type IV secretion protein Dot [Legionella pneumophila]HAT8182649.1 type IV secretion protein Dot [Legionella pneumophila]